MANAKSTKTCPRCKTEKPAGEFGPNRARHDGLAVYCRPCVREKSREAERTDASRRAGAEAQRRYRKRHGIGHDPQAAKQYRDANRDRINARRRETYRPEYYLRWREKKLAADPGYFKRRAAAQKNNPAYKKYQLRSHLRRKYGLTVAEYEEMVRRQGGLCAICKEAGVAGDGAGRLCVDHDHETGRVRGLLCRVCNKMLGLARDKTEILLAAVEYLNRHRGQTE